MDEKSKVQVTYLSLVMAELEFEAASSSTHSSVPFPITCLHHKNGMRGRFTFESGKKRIAYGETFWSVKTDWNLAAILHKPVKKSTAIHRQTKNRNLLRISNYFILHNKKVIMENICKL